MFDAKKLLDAMMAASQAPSAPATQGAGSGQGGLGGLLGSVLSQISQTGQPAQPGQGTAPGAAGGLGDIIGSLLGQATQGVQGAARDVDSRTGVGGQLDSVLAGLTGGKGAGDLVARAREIAAANPGAAGAIMGSLGGLFLGSKAGRGLALDATKLGGLAMIGGLAYQAWQNYQAGKPPLALGQTSDVAEAPAESPFGQTGDAHADNETSLLLLRAMIAAASADGSVDDAERAHIVGNLQAIGLDAEAAGFLDQEFASPASPEDLAAAASGPEVGAEVYTAARLTIDPDAPEEQAFLASLATALGLDAELVAHIDAAAESAKVSA